MIAKIRTRIPAGVRPQSIPLQLSQADSLLGKEDFVFESRHLTPTSRKGQPWLGPRNLCNLRHFQVATVEIASDLGGFELPLILEIPSFVLI